MPQRRRRIAGMGSIYSQNRAVINMKTKVEMILDFLFRLQRNR